MRNLALLLLLAAGAAPAGEKPTLRYRPATTDDERPVPTEVVVAPQGSDVAIRLHYSAEPWGEACKKRCANTTLYLDTDDSKATGLRLADKAAAENGADLSVTVIGSREYHDEQAELALKVKVRELGSDATRLEEGKVSAELDNARDDDRVRVDGKTVSLKVDATSGTLPSGKRMRVVFHPFGAEPIVGHTRGFLAQHGAGKVEVFRKGKSDKKVEKPKDEDAEAKP